jgi:diguanylate cyclase (GGDEF)-like protein
LTDLPNRAYLMERLRSCIARGRRDRDYRFGLLFVDVDNFKLINDCLGHRVGDQLLTHMASMMAGVIGAIRTSDGRSQDLVSRLGGDEFVVLLDDVGDADNVVRIAERIREQACCTVDFGHRKISPGLSIGAAISTDEYEDAADLLRDADTALYHAKAEGKGKIALFDHAMRSEVLERAELESDLQRAVAQGEFVVYFQPIVSLESNRLCCLEALVRWRHPTRGLVFPDEFIAAAEQNGLIEAIGEQVLEQVCRQMAEWRAAGGQLGEVSVSVNVAARQLVGDRLLGQIDACLERYQLDPSALKIELTETTAIRAIDASRCVFEALARRGIEIYLDDFGIGYSSLGTLHSLPFSAIKLDRSFVKGLEAEPENAATVRAMVMIAETRGIRLIAEGIETSEQLATLRSLDCLYGQGFLFSRPLPAEELERLFDNASTGMDGAKVVIVEALCR